MRPARSLFRFMTERTRYYEIICAWKHMCKLKAFVPTVRAFVCLWLKEPGRDCLSRNFSLKCVGQGACVGSWQKEHGSRSIKKVHFVIIKWESVQWLSSCLCQAGEGKENWSLRIFPSMWVARESWMKITVSFVKSEKKNTSIKKIIKMFLYSDVDVGMFAKGAKSAVLQ